MNDQEITQVLCTLAAMAGIMLCGQMAVAQASAPDEAPVAAESKGLLPIPDYSGDLWQRAYLTGDWGGTRAGLADKGVQINLHWNQYLQGVADGGRDETTRYGGHLDYLVNLDLMRMGVLEGALVKFRAESRYGNSVNAEAGPILPVNTDAFFPLTSTIDEDIAFTITDLNYTQFLSPKWAVLMGKVDTLDGDPNEFASGRGTSQFMNANLAVQPRARFAASLQHARGRRGLAARAGECQVHQRQQHGLQHRRFIHHHRLR